MLTLLWACSSDDETLFDETPAERIKQNNEKLLDLLLAEENGYRGVYFSKDDEFGGFNFYMKFNADGTVLMTSDFDSETALESSSYEVRLGTTGTELVFTTRNHIQKVSNTLAPGLIGVSFKGTSVFQFFAEDNGVITLKDIRNQEQASFVLEPTGFSDFNTESVVKAEASLAQRNNFLPTPSEPVFQILRIQNNSKTSSFNLKYDGVRLYTTSTILAEDDTITEINFGIAYTEDGMTISPTLEFEGESYTDFIYNSGTRSYVSTVNGTTATILFEDTPAYINDDVNRLPSYDGAGFYHLPAFGKNALTSAGHDALLELVGTNLAAQGYSLDYYLLVTNFESDNDCATFLGIQATRIQNGQPFRARYCFDKPTIQNKKLFLNYTGPFDNNSSFFEASVTPLINMYNSSKGLIYSQEGNFTTDQFNAPNDAATYTSLDDPTLRVYGVWITL